MSTEFICLATFTAKEKQCEKLKEILTSLVNETRKEPGCVRYTLNQSTENKNCFSVIEYYKDEAAFNYHSNQPYLLHLKEVLPELVDAVAINTYAEIA